MEDETGPGQTALLDAALTHVPFDGWTNATFRAAIADVQTSEETAKSWFPNGPLDLAAAFHRRGDAEMLARMAATDARVMKIREKVTAAVRYRLEAVPDKELVRRASTLFALPQNAALGAQLIWGTADAIWTALGDTSEDINWYSKRATLAAVYASTVLFWLGDDSPDQQATWAFLDRRIEDVMQIEKMKAQVRDNPVLTRMMAGPNWLLSHIKAPSQLPRDDLPGHWNARN